MRPQVKSSVVVRLLKLLVKLLFWLVVIALPLLGAWIGSALAAYQNGPTWVPIVAAALAFPVLPLVWEAFDRWRAARKDAKRMQKLGARFGDKTKQHLTLGDRLIVRTAAVNLVFLGVLFVWFPASIFTALSTRGDWFLDRNNSPWVPEARSYIFGAADQLEWLWELTHDNPFAEEDDDEPKPKPKPTPKPTPTAKPQPAPKPTPVPSGEGGAAPTPDDPPAVEQPKRWPFQHELHPAVANMPESVQTDVQSVGKYLASEESDPFLLVKALHDYAANRVAYDAPALAAGRYPPQDANTVFSTKTGVCAGYAKLLVALGKAAGSEIIYVVGQSRDMGGNVSGQGHAWNAAKIEGDWYLVDATWDAGYVNGDAFTRKYTSDYLLTPPNVFGLNHYPDDSDWQLREDPISRGEFMRQPNVRPMLYANGFELLSPDRSQVTVDGGDFEISLSSTDNKWLRLYWGKKGTAASEGKSCPIQHGPRTTGRCSLPGRGTYHVSLFVGEKEYGTAWYAGQFEVNKR